MSKQKGLAPILIVLLIALAVGGYLIYTNYFKDRYQTVPVKQTQSTPVPTSQNESTGSAASPAPTSAEDTANWKTYINTGWKISFRYPSDWQSIEEPGESGMLVKTTDLQMKDYSNISRGAFLYGPYVPAALPLSWDKVFDGYTSGKVEVLKENLIIDSQPTKVGLIKKPSAVEMIVSYRYPKAWNYYDNAIEYSFINLVSNPGNFEANKKIFKEILSTFKFLDQNQMDTTNWKTYREASYVFQYPNEGYQVQKDNELSYSKRYNLAIPKDFIEFLGYSPPQVVQAVRLFQTTPEGLTSADKTVFSLWIFNNENDISIDTWYSKYWYYPFNWGKAIPSEVERRKPKLQTTVGNKIAQLSINDDLGKVQHIYVNKDRKIFLFWVKGDLNESSIGNQILSTFRFDSSP